MDPTELSLARAEPASVAPAESLTPAGSPQGGASLFDLRNAVPFTINLLHSLRPLRPPPSPPGDREVLSVGPLVRPLWMMGGRGILSTFAWRLPVAALPRGTETAYATIEIARQGTWKPNIRKGVCSTEVRLWSRSTPRLTSFEAP